MDQGGLQQIFAATRAELTRFLLARGMCREDAEDLLQDLYIRIDAGVPGPVSEPRAYLYKMANNLAHDRRRTEESRKRREGAWLTEHGGLPSDGERGSDPLSALQARDHLRRVEASLDRLPERTSSIFRRHRIGGETQKAIAASLGISLSAVEKHLQRAYRVVLDLRRRFEIETATAKKNIHEGGPDVRSP